MSAVSIPAAGSSTGYRSAVVVRRSARSQGWGLIESASAGALAFSLAIPLVILLLYATWPSESSHFLWALLATAIYLPLHVRHVYFGLRQQRPRALPWTLAAMTAVVAGFTPVLGTPWFYAWHAPAASILVTTRRRFGFVALACILVAVGVWASKLQPLPGWSPVQDFYLSAAVLDRAMGVFILVWLVGALRTVQVRRRALADQALEIERGLVDDELTRTVGVELAEILEQGDRALALLARNRHEAEAELRALVARSRDTLAHARRLTSGYQAISAEAELARAAALLRAASIEARAEVSGPPVPLSAPLREELRAAVVRLLSDPPARTIVLRLTDHDGEHRLETQVVGGREVLR